MTQAGSNNPLLLLDEIDKMSDWEGSQLNKAKEILAYELTSLVHGKEEAEKAAMKYYTIKSGDTLGRIAINNGTTVNALCRLNGITPKTTLKIGRKIRVK